MGHLLARTTQQDAQKSEDTSSSATDALLRIQLERGHGTWTDDTEGRVDAPSYQAAIDGQQFAEGTSWGGRLSAGLGQTFAHDRAAVFLIAGLGLSRYESEEFVLPLAGHDLRWKSRPWAWSATTGIELQFLWRVVSMGADVGLGGVALLHRELEPPELELENKYKTGVLGRLRMGLGAPLPGGWRLGVEVSAEGFIQPRMPFSPGMTPRGSRTALALVVEWDSGRWKK